MAGRRLDPHEVALWRRVAQTARAYHPPAPDSGTPMMVTSTAPVPKITQKSGRLASVPPSAPAKPAARRIDAATLDGSWDKKMLRGQLVPDRSIDLHGFRLDAAYPALMAAIARARADHVRVLLVITGRAGGKDTAQHNPRLPPTSRGVIRASLIDWLSASDHFSAIAAVRAAHPRHGGAGAFYVILRADRKIRS